MMVGKTGITFKEWEPRPAAFVECQCCKIEPGLMKPPEFAERETELDIRDMKGVGRCTWNVPLWEQLNDGIDDVEPSFLASLIGTHFTLNYSPFSSTSSIAEIADRPRLRATYWRLSC
jgi:hypothetical protein